MKPPRGLTVGLFLLAQSQIVAFADAAQAGVNTLEIDIVNPWNNRLVGDSQLPVGERRTSLSLATLKPNSPRQPAGLLRAAGTEPVYRRLTAGTDGTQGANDEADQAAPNARKKKK